MESFQNLEYAYSINDSVIKVNNKNESQTPFQDFNPGFRIGLNKLFYKDFYFDVNWTYLRLKHDSSITTTEENLLGALLPPDDFNVMSKASSHLSGYFTTLDIRVHEPLSCQ